MTADKELTRSDYLLIQQAASLAFGVVHNLMDRIQAASPEWDNLRAWNEKLGAVSSAAYAAGFTRREAPAPCSRTSAHTPHDRCPGTF